MKTMLLTSAAIALSLSVGRAQQFQFHDDHHGAGIDHNHGIGLEGDLRGALLSRLSMAPRLCGCSGPDAKVPSIQNATLAASGVKLLGKVEYGYGQSCLGHEAKHGIEGLILNSGLCHCPDSLIVILGFADRTGCSSVNFRLSGDRAEAVENLIREVGWERGLRFQTATVAMGEEAQLCNHSLGHNRVAEIWVLEFPRVVGVVEQQTVETRIVQAPAPAAQATLIPVPSAPQGFISHSFNENAPNQFIAVPAENGTSFPVPQAPQMFNQPQGFNGPAPFEMAPAPQAPQMFNQPQGFSAPAPFEMAPAPQGPQMFNQPQGFNGPAPFEMAPAPQGPQMFNQPQGFNGSTPFEMAPAPQGPQMLNQPQGFNGPAPFEMAPAPQGPQMFNQPQSFSAPAPFEMAPAPQGPRLILPEGQSLAPVAPTPNLVIPAPAASLSNSIESAIPDQARPVQELVQVAPGTPVPSGNQVMMVPGMGNPLQSLADFLEKNVILSDSADRNEFARKLDALKRQGLPSGFAQQN